MVLMVRSRVSGVSNHGEYRPSFETRFALLRMRDATQKPRSDPGFSFVGCILTRLAD
jgi:hypothetical protein